MRRLSCWLHEMTTETGPERLRHSTETGSRIWGDVVLVLRQSEAVVEVVNIARE